MAQFPFILSTEARELSDEVRELFEDLAATLPPEQRAYSGECHPTLDVLETDEAVEVLVDVSGIPATALRIVFRAGVLLIAGEKAPPRTSEDSTFHLVEREFGRFARAVRLTGAFDVGAARASVDEGELTIVLPKLIERRDQPHRIVIATGPSA
ncbi:MAG TPA: Hsp20/alpha crystallin family protein [Vicinamibacterales bacterium]|nr:Hsp20/alpha crystallin family protein [Vicinamibacterales bacterium]